MDDIDQHMVANKGASISLLPKQGENSNFYTENPAGGEFLELGEKKSLHWVDALDSFLTCP